MSSATGLNVTVWGDGEAAVFVHGSFGWGEETWREQRPLSDTYRLLLVDRRAFGFPAAATLDGLTLEAARSSMSDQASMWEAEIPLGPRRPQHSRLRNSPQRLGKLFNDRCGPSRRRRDRERS